MTLYLTSKNKDKYNASRVLLNKFGITEIISIESDSGIEGGQPYGLEETMEGCINRTKQFRNNENFISIENGFVRDTNEEWYDIAYVYIRINDIYYSGWSEKRRFPKHIYNKTEELICYFEKNSISRFKQLYNLVCNTMLL